MTTRESIRKALTTPQTFKWPMQLLNRGAFVSGTRPAWSRLQNLLAILNTRETFNAAAIAKILKLNKKTINRDIGFLRKQGLKIDFDFHKNTYRLAGKIPPNFSLTKEVA